MKRKRGQKNNVQTKPLSLKNIVINDQTYKPYNLECAHRVFPFPQGQAPRGKGGVCWLAAVMAVFFLSERMRLLVAEALPALEGWKRPLAHTIAQSYFERDSHTGEAYTNALLFAHRLEAANPFFNHRTNTKFGGVSVVFISRFLNYFEIPHAFFVRPYGYTFAVPDKWNLHLPFNRNARASHLTSRQAAVAPFVSLTHPRVLIIHTWSKYARSTNRGVTANVLSPNAQGVLLRGFQLRNLLPNRHALSIKWMGSTYRLDSVIFSNSNGKQCGGNHATAGVTCGGKRYFYNGWPSGNGIVCPLQPFDWSQRKKFSIKSGDCGVKNATSYNPAKNLEYDTVDKTFAIYVRVD